MATKTKRPITNHKSKISNRQRRALERARAIALSRLPPRDPFALRLPTEVVGPAAPREPGFGGASPLAPPLWQRQAEGRLTPTWTPLPTVPDPPPPLAAAPPAFASGIKVQE